LLCLRRIISAKEGVESWAYTDKDGWFYLGAPEAQKLILAFNPAQTRSQNQKSLFFQNSFREIGKSGEKTLGSLDDLKNEIAKTEGSFYVVREESSGGTIYRFYTFNLNLPLTNRIEAEDLPSEVGKVEGAALASGGKLRRTISGNANGYLVSGPYIDLNKGRYKVNFFVRSRDKSDKKIILDVISGQGSESHAQKEVTLGEINGNSFKEVSLDFELKEAKSSVEFRLKAPRASNVELDFITLRQNTP